ncbi:hypothetical protein C8J56DRAFT_1025333 [Mycena floridula]|nr:hypothetical protein C8J56DRAFT_1025333 [Mycena floridula]
MTTFPFLVDPTSRNIEQTYQVIQQDGVHSSVNNVTASTIPKENFNVMYAHAMLYNLLLHHEVEKSEDTHGLGNTGETAPSFKLNGKLAMFKLDANSPTFEMKHKLNVNQVEDQELVGSTPAAPTQEKTFLTLLAFKPQPMSAIIP